MKRIGLFLLIFMLIISPVVAISASSIHWGIASTTNEEVPYPGEQLENLIKKYDAIYLGDKKKKEVYLTFDNGYELGYTPKILDTLKEKKVPAIFFVTGQFVREHPELVKRMVEEGHIVGNHTWHHPQLTTVNEVRFEKELQMLKDEVGKITKQKEMKYMRPPEGIFNEFTLAKTKELGYTHVFWSLAYMDWDVENQHGWQNAYHNITKKIHPGAVILLHTVSKDNADGLGQIIDEIERRGYEFKSLDDINKEKYTLRFRLFP